MTWGILLHGQWSPTKSKLELTIHGRGAKDHPMVMTLYKPWWRIMRARNVPFANVCQPLVTALDPNTSLLLFFPQTQSHSVALEPQNDSSFSHFQCFRGFLGQIRDFSVFSDLTRLSVNSSFLAACLHLSKAVKWGNSDAGVSACGRGSNSHETM